MPFDRKKRLKGNVALITVIIASAILVVSGLSVLASAMDVSLSSKSYLNRNLAEMAMTTCLEESMALISHSVNYTGSFAITISDDSSCSATVTTDIVDTNLKIIQLIAIYENYTITRTKIADTSTSPYTLSN